jgi:hypothetical protein
MSSLAPATQLFIDGKFIDSKTKTFMDVLNPVALPLSFPFSFYPSLSFSFSLSLSLSFSLLFRSLALTLSIYISIYPSIYLSLFLTDSLALSLSVHFCPLCLCEPACSTFVHLNHICPQMLDLLCISVLFLSCH